MPVYLALVLIALTRNMCIHAWNYLIYGGRMIAFDKEHTPQQIAELLEDTPDLAVKKMEEFMGQHQQNQEEPEEKKQTFVNFR